MEILKLINIEKEYTLNKESISILKNINFSFYKGEIVAIKGESGSGKSTLLNIIGGIDSKYSGELYYEGKLLSNNLDLYRKNNIGFVFQNYNLISYLNLIDNVAINLMFSNINYKKRKRLAIKALTSVGLKEHIYKKPNEISGGQKQRVSIARAIINNPRILICDEPTGSLDSKNTKEVLDIFRELAISGKTIIIATHSDEVSSISHRLIRLKDGKIEEEKILNDFLEYYDEKEEEKINKKISIISSMFLSYHNAKQKIFRNLLVSFGASIGIMGLLIMLSLSTSVKKYINDAINTSRNSDVIDVYKEKQSNNKLSLKTFNDKDINMLNDLEYVKTMNYGFYTNGSYNLNINGEIHSFNTINSNSKQLTNNFLFKGNFPKEGEILINYYFFDNIGESVINKNIIFENKTFKISGVYEDGTKEKTIYMNYKDINSIFNVEPNIIYLESTDVDKLKNEVIKEGLYLSYLEDSLSIFNDTFNVIIYILTFGSILSLLISSILIMVVLYISVLERTKEIGIFRALGIGRNEVKKIFISDGLLYGIISGIIGIVLSSLILKLTDYFVLKTFSIEISTINVNYIFFAFFLSIFISLISSIYPANKASKLNIIDALRYE